MLVKGMRICRFYHTPRKPHMTMETTTICRCISIKNRDFPARHVCLLEGNFKSHKSRKSIFYTISWFQYDLFLCLKTLGPQTIPVPWVDHVLGHCFREDVTPPCEAIVV